jgi:hypothetical protein
MILWAKSIQQTRERRAVMRAGGAVRPGGAGEEEGRRRDPLAAPPRALHPQAPPGVPLVRPGPYRAPVRLPILLCDSGRLFHYETIVAGGFPQHYILKLHRECLRWVKPPTASLTLFNSVCHTPLVRHMTGSREVLMPCDPARPYPELINDLNMQGPGAAGRRGLDVWGVLQRRALSRELLVCQGRSDSIVGIPYEGGAR